LETDIIFGDRRNHRRYQLDLDLSFRQLAGKLNHNGTGRILNISSGGVLFVTATPPPISSSVELSVDWPCPGEDGTAISLLMVGRIVRTMEGAVAVQTTRHEFRNSQRSIAKGVSEAAVSVQ
jgi:hypothetical protein